MRQFPFPKRVYRTRSQAASLVVRIWLRYVVVEIVQARKLYATIARFFTIGSWCGSIPCIIALW